MSPDQVAAALRKIAAMIDRSQSPSRSLVASNLRKLVSAVVYEYGPESDSGMGDVVTIEEEEKEESMPRVPPPSPALQIEKQERREERPIVPPWLFEGIPED